MAWTVIEEIREKIRINRPLLDRIFKLNKEDTLMIMKKLVEHENFEGFIFDKTFRNDEPYNIDIGYFDRYIIDIKGISYKPEHGDFKVIASLADFILIMDDLNV